MVTSPLESFMKGLTEKQKQSVDQLSKRIDRTLDNAMSEVSISPVPEEHPMLLEAEFEAIGYHRFELYPNRPSDHKVGMALALAYKDRGWNVRYSCKDVKGKAVVFHRGPNPDMRYYLTFSKKIC